MDRYTKTVLTGILLCLVYLCAWVTATPTRAAQEQRVVIVGWEAEVAGRAQIHRFDDMPLPVRMPR